MPKNKLRKIKKITKEKILIEKLLDKKISRREFLKYALIGIGGLATAAYGYNHLFGRKPSALSTTFKGAAPDELWKWSKEAYHYTKIGENVQCQVCPHKCSLEPGDRSICRNKVNIKGKLYTLAYGNPCSVHVDPIEKKPLFHFLPTTKIFSIATAGCSFRCLNCQNWEISQSKPEETTNYDLMPKNVIAAALKEKCTSIAYTYSEPVSFYEYMYDTSKIATANNLKNVWVTAGYINKEPLIDLCKYMDAANVDLKSFKDEIYNELNSGKLGPVLDTLKTLKEQKVWFEVTNLIVPTYTDEPDMIRDMCSWLVKNIGEDYPLHFSRFSPAHKLVYLPATPVDTLEKARKIALDSGLNYVYIGNVPGHESENTYCPKCGKIVIERKGYAITQNNLSDGSCKFCGENIAGVWA